MDFNPFNAAAEIDSSYYDSIDDYWYESVFSLRLDWQGFTGIESEVTESSMVIYPNPTSDMLNITSSVNIEQIAILDMSGKLVQYLTHTYNNQLQLNVSQLARGIYILSIKTSKGIVTKKFIKN